MLDYLAMKVFGTFIDTFKTETYYLATTDGIVVAWLKGLAGQSSTTIHGITDQVEPTNNVVASFIINVSEATGTITMPVKKGYVWRVTDTVGGFNTDYYQITWIPLGQ